MPRRSKITIDYKLEQRKSADKGAQRTATNVNWKGVFPALTTQFKQDQSLDAFPEENRALWNLATSGRWEEARELYRWYTPLLHLDTKIKLVQYIKLAMAECGLGSEMVRAPRLPIEGPEREEILGVIRRAIATRPALPALAAR